MKTFWLLCSVALLLLFIIGGAVFVFFIKDDPEKGRIPSAALPRVSVLTVSPPPKRREVKLLGIVQRVPPVRLTTTMGGRVAEVFVEEGQVLKPEEPILQLDASRLLFAYQALQMKLAFVQAQLQLAMMGDPAIMIPTDDSVAWVNSTEPDELPETPQDKADLQDDSSAAPPVTTIPMPSRTPPAESPELLRAQKEYDQLLARMQAIRLGLDALTLTSPESGKLVRFKIKPGDVVQANQVIAELVTLSAPVKITAAVPQKVFAHLRVGQKTELRLEQGGNLFKTPGHITQTVSQAVPVPTSPETPTMAPTPAEESTTPTTTPPETISPTDAPTKPQSAAAAWGQITVEPFGGAIRRLEPGKSVQVIVEIPGEGTLWIPAEAVFHRGGRHGVYVVHTRKGKHRVEVRQVQLGQTEGEAVEILKGLQAGEKIVSTGQNLLHDKQEVAVIGAGPVEP